jgi:hypothetical protein
MWHWRARRRCWRREDRWRGVGADRRRRLGAAWCRRSEREVGSGRGAPGGSGRRRDCSDRDERGPHLASGAGAGRQGRVGHGYPSRRRLWCSLQHPSGHPGRGRRDTPGRRRRRYISRCQPSHLRSRRRRFPNRHGHPWKRAGGRRSRGARGEPRRRARHFPVRRAGRSPILEERRRWRRRRHAPRGGKRRGLTGHCRGHGGSRIGLLAEPLDELRRSRPQFPDSAPRTARRGRVSCLPNHELGGRAGGGKHQSGRRKHGDAAARWRCCGLLEVGRALHRADRPVTRSVPGGPARHTASGGARSGSRAPTNDSARPECRCRRTRSGRDRIVRASNNAAPETTP